MTPSIPVRLLALFLMLIFLPAPLLVVIGASFSPGVVLRFPPEGFSLRWFEAIWESRIWLKTFGYSALIAMIVAVVTTISAIGAALALSRAPQKVRSAAEIAILAPLLFPSAAIGIAFLAWLIEFGLNGTMFGILYAHLILCIPFAYRPIAVSLNQLDPSIAEAANILGATPMQRLTRVVLPMLRPGIATALLFTFIISFDEVTVTMFLVGPTFTTLPVSIYAYVHDSIEPVVAAISTLLICMTVALVFLLDRFAGLQFLVNVNDLKK